MGPVQGLKTVQTLKEVEPLSKENFKPSSVQMSPLYSAVNQTNPGLFENREEETVRKPRVCPLNVVWVTKSLRRPQTRLRGSGRITALSEFGTRTSRNDTSPLP